MVASALDDIIQNLVWPHQINYQVKNFSNAEVVSKQISMQRALNLVLQGGVVSQPKQKCL